MAKVEEVVLLPPQDGQGDQDDQDDQEVEAEKENQIKSDVAEKGVGKEDSGEKGKDDNETNETSDSLHSQEVPPMTCSPTKLESCHQVVKISSLQTCH